MEPDDAYWRRPDAGVRSPGAVAGPAAGAPAASSWSAPYPGASYAGPPPTTPPPTHWRPPHIVEPAPPRRLPVQDHPGLDDEEARARTLTMGLGLVAGAIVVILLCAVCGRALF